MSKRSDAEGHARRAAEARAVSNGIRRLAHRHLDAFTSQLADQVGATGETRRLLREIIRQRWEELRQCSR